jgi:hypothetical protein
MSVEKHMLDKPTFKVGQMVRFTEAYLARSTPAERARFSGRVGEVTSYRMGAKVPTVFFPKSGRLAERKLFDVASGSLELAPAHAAGTTAGKAAVAAAAR